jgi:ATP-dependent phosphofructokinase / diphosphate-dependent phosphofructokinase
MLKGRALIGQSGGPTSVINSSLAGVVDGLADLADCTGVLGMRWGVEGLMAENLIELQAESAEAIGALRRTPGSALGSSRHKVTDEDLPKILAVLQGFDIRTIFMIGGNDTMDTIHRITDYAAAQGYPMCGVGVPKTVDNDLYGTDHTPGFASAARYMALSVQQAGRLARDMQKVDQFVVFQCIGRDAGWLAAASALAKREPADAPHLIYTPERVFDGETFLADADAIYNEHGYVSVVCGEGIKYADGTPVSASQTKDKFANVEFGAMGGASVALNLHKILSDHFGWRGEFQITESLPMSAIDRAVPQDLVEAYEVGLAAARLAEQEASGKMVSIERTSNDPYGWQPGSADLADVAVRAKPMPEEFLTAEGNFPSDAFFDYARPLIGEIEDFARLAYTPAAK